MSGASPCAWATPPLPGPTPETAPRRFVPFRDADEAIEAARAWTGSPPLLLIPPAGAAGQWGLGWHHALKARFAGDADIAVDCDGDPALAREALRQGFAHVIFTGGDAFEPELADFAARQGAVLYRRRP